MNSHDHIDLRLRAAAVMQSRGHFRLSAQRLST